jgi:hypothetical protein
MDQSKAIPNIEVEDIDHLGIIAGIINDIGMVEIINQHVGEHLKALRTSTTDFTVPQSQLSQILFALLDNLPNVGSSRTVH